MKKAVDDSEVIRDRIVYNVFSSTAGITSVFKIFP